MGVILMLLPMLEEAGRAAWWWQVAAFAAVFAVVLPISYLSHRLVEVPGQRLGRALWQRYGTPRPPAAQAEPAPATDDPDTRVSVIIPNYNKAKTLRACLESVYRQGHPPFEVIVVDDASTDGSRAIAAEFPCRLVAFEANRGVSAARNAGAAAATGDVLFFVDSDIALATDAVANAVGLLRERPDRGVVQGIYEAQPLFPDGPVEAYKTLFEHYWRQRSAGVVDATLFALTAVPRRVFEEVGGFDEKMRDAEDIEFGTRLPARYAIWMSDRVLGRHDDVDRFWPYMSEHVGRARNYGALVARLLLGRARPGPDRGSRGVDVATVACMVSCALAVVALPLAVVSGWLLLVPLALVVVFVTIDRRLWGFVRREKGSPFLLYFIPMHFLMHTTQIVGMLAGAVAATVRPGRQR
ncbi:glycosyltransferase [Phytohabitans flavus]